MEESKNLEQNLDKSNEKLHISDVSDSVIQDFLSTKKYIKSCVSIVEDDGETYIESDELIRDFIDFIKHYH